MSPEEKLAGALSEPQTRILARLLTEHPVGWIAAAFPSRSLAALVRRGLVEPVDRCSGSVARLTPKGERVAESRWSPCEDCDAPTPPSGFDVAFDVRGFEVHVCPVCLSTRDSEGYPVTAARGVSPEVDPLAFRLLARLYVDFCDRREQRGRGGTRFPVGSTTISDAPIDGERPRLAAARRLEAAGLAEVSRFRAIGDDSVEWWVSSTDEGISFFEARWEWSRAETRWVARAARPQSRRNA